MGWQFNEHLKRIRKISKTTQQELAEYLDISVQSVSKWEKGKALPSINYIPKIAEFYHCPIDAFFSEYSLKLHERFPHREDHTASLIKAFESMIKPDDDKKEKSVSCYVYDAIPMESLFLPEVYKFLKENEYFTVARLQNKLRIGYSLARRVQDALIKMGILLECIPGNGNPIVKEKLKLMIPYIENKQDAE